MKTKITKCEKSKQRNAFAITMEMEYDEKARKSTDAVFFHFFFLLQGSM